MEIWVLYDTIPHYLSHLLAKWMFEHIASIVRQSNILRAELTDLDIINTAAI